MEIMILKWHIELLKQVQLEVVGYLGKAAHHKKNSPHLGFFSG
jgi:hypothetical protein